MADGNGKGNFYQRLQQWVRTAPLFGSPKQVLFGLAAHSNNRGECFPSIATLCTSAGIKSRSTVSSALSYLEQHGYIERKKRQTTSGAHTSNFYRLNADHDHTAIGLGGSDNQTTPSAVIEQEVTKTEVTISEAEENEDSTSDSTSAVAKLPDGKPKSSGYGTEENSPLKISAARFTCAEILRGYISTNPTPKQAVGFWWALRYSYFPETKWKGPHELSKRNFGHLWRLFKEFPGGEAFFLLAFAFEEWNLLKTAKQCESLMSGAPEYPSPAFVRQTSELIDLFYALGGEHLMKGSPDKFTPLTKELSTIKLHQG